MNATLRLGFSIFWLIFGAVLVIASVIPTVRIGLALIGTVVFLAALALVVSTLRQRASKN